MTKAKTAGTVLAEVRRSVEHAAGAGDRGGVPVELRRQVTAIVRAEAAAGGRTARSIADEVGVHQTTISRWLREEREASGAPARRGRAFRRVRVVEERVAPESSRALRATHAASGIVVDGLDVATLVALLRSLGS